MYSSRLISPKLQEMEEQVVVDQDEEVVVVEEEVEGGEQDEVEKHVNATASEMLSAVRSGSNTVRAPVVQRIKPTGCVISKG